MARKRGADVGGSAIQMWGVMIHPKSPVRQFSDLEGAMRNDSIPIDDQVRDLFLEHGFGWSRIRFALGLSNQELSFGDFLKLIGAANSDEYWTRLSSARIRVRNKTGWQINRKKAFERDGDRCAVCGSTVGLNVHHIDQFSASKNSQLDNLVTLCRLHHAAAHEQSNAFFFRELCGLAGESTENRYTERQLARVKRKAKRHLLSAGVHYSDRDVRNKAEANLLRFMTEYKGYVDSNFPVKIRIFKRHGRRDDGSHCLYLSLRVGYKRPRTVRKRSRKR